MPNLHSSAVSVGGWRLDDFAAVILDRSGLDTLPALVGQNVQVPGRDGTIWQRKDLDEGHMVLSILVQGRDSNGALVVADGTSEVTLRKNLDALYARCLRRGILQTVTKTLADGTTRTNLGEVTAAITTDYVGTETDSLATVNVEFTFPDPLWKDAAGPVQQTFTTAAGSAGASATSTLSTFVGITADIPDAVYLVKGPATNPKISDPVTGDWVQYSGALTASDYWRVDCGLFTSYVGTDCTVTSNGTGTSKLAQTTYGSGPRWPAVRPPLSGGQATLAAPTVTLAATAGQTAATSLTVYATRRFYA